MMSPKLTAAELSGVVDAEARGDLVTELGGIIESRKINAAEYSLNLPWGILLKIREEMAEVFMNRFFEKENLPKDISTSVYEPRMMAIEKGRSLPWMASDKKETFVSVLAGTPEIYKSLTDKEGLAAPLATGELIHIPEMVRYRLASTTGISLVAQISKNNNPRASRKGFLDGFSRS